MRIYKYISLFFATIITVITIFICFPKLLKEEDEEIPKGYNMIVNIWHVDTFQGGEGSRRKFLSDVSKKFEKKNPGVLFIVLDKSVNEVNDLIEKNVYPDLLSYGNGINVLNTETIKIDKNYIGCESLGKLKALPWCCGRYFILENNLSKVESLIVSKQQFNQPFLSLIYSKLKFEEIYEQSPDKAFLNFINGKCKYLLGTQRDVIKCENLGKEIKVSPLDNFNDLNQYISITSKDKTKIDIANDFIVFLLSEETQKTLNKISLFSCFYKVDLKYEKLMEEKKSSINKTLRYLINDKESRDLFLLSKDIYKNKKEINKIENLDILY